MPDAGLSASPAPPRRTSPWPAVGIFAATLAAYLPVLENGFVWGDRESGAGASLLSWRGLARIWFVPGATPSYAPLSQSLLWLEQRLWGDLPWGYHLASILLHALAACLFARVLLRLSVPGAWLAALIFALHPVNVESVAWIPGQANALSAVFYLLAVLAYLRFDRQREPAPYFAGLGFFFLAVLSGSTAAALPAALLVVAWWRRGRLSGWQDIVPLLPFAGLAAVAGLINAWVGTVHPVAPAAALSLTLGQRYLLAGRAIWFYADKVLWPAHLTFIYPRWTADTAAAWQYAFPLGAIALLLALWRWRESSRAPLAAVLFFIVSLFPSLVFYHAPVFQFSWVADRSVYLACLGIIALAAAAFVPWLDRIAPPAQWAARVLAAALVLALGGLTWRQGRKYHDMPTFYQAILAGNPDAWLAQANLGALRQEAGDLPEALLHLEAASRLRPADADIRERLGDALAEAGRLPEALTAYAAALSLKPDSAQLQLALGNALVRSDRTAEALEHYQEALRLGPNDPALNSSVGRALLQLGRAAEAIEPYQRALALQPDSAEAHDDLGNALTAVDRLPEAIQEFQQAVRLDPDYLEAHFNLGIALLQLGRAAEAKVQFAEALRINPDYRPARDALERLSADSRP